MELVTASDLFVTASLALLLTFLVARFVSLAMTDTHTATKRHAVHDEPVGPVLRGELLTVQTGQSESRVEFISPVQFVETEHKIEEANSVEPDSNPVTSDSDIAVIKEVIADTVEVTEKFDDSAEERNVESGEEIRVESSNEMEVSVVENDDDDEDDDWEGIERSELEKVFMAATEFVSGGENGLGSVGSNVEMEFYGLHKIATEGPCREPQPMPLKLSARAKWNAWQKLGNMSPEVAMEQYINLLSEKVPGWMKDTSAVMNEHESTSSEVYDSAATELSTSFTHQQMSITQGELEQASGCQDRSPLTVSNLENNVQK